MVNYGRPGQTYRDPVTGRYCALLSNQMTVDYGFSQPDVNGTVVGGAPRPVQIISGSAASTVSSPPPGTAPPIAPPGGGSAPEAPPVGSRAAPSVAGSYTKLDPVEAPKRNAVKNYRNWGGTVGSATFTFNAVLAVGVSIWQIRNAAAKKDGQRSGAEVASAVIGLTGALANIGANGFKALDSFGKVLVNKYPHDFIGPHAVGGPKATGEARGTRFRPKTSKIFGLLGTYGGGLANGAAGLFVLAPYWGSDKLTSEQKGVVAAESVIQFASAGLQIGGNAWLAQVVGRGIAYPLVPDAASFSGATRLVRHRSLMGPMGLTFTAGAMLALSPLEIYALAKQSEYATDLDKLASGGYAGHGLLADFYREKNGVQAGIFATSAILDIVSSLAVAACVVSGVGAPIAIPLGLVVTGISAVFRAAEYAFIEKMAEKAVQKIYAYVDPKDSSRKGPQAYFENSLNAQNKSLSDSAMLTDYLAKLQGNYGSVVWVDTQTMSPQAMELAALIRNTTDLVTAKAYIERFSNGISRPTASLRIDAETGELNLDNDGTAKLGSTQLLTFLNPLLAPGKETRKKGHVGGKTSSTSLTLTDANGTAYTIGKGWTINDGNASSTMDLTNVVTKVINKNMTDKLELPITVNGGGGDDKVIANASAMRFDGGDGFDVVDYQHLANDGGIAAITSKRQDGNRVVTKVMANVDTYHEVTGQYSYAPTGKRVENVESREFELTKIDTDTKTDTLVNVERIIGSDGNDVIDESDATPTPTPTPTLGTIHKRQMNPGALIDGSGGNDIITGGNSDESLVGGTGCDLVCGNAGNDLVYQDIELVNDTIDGGDDTDTASYNLTKLSGKAAAQTVVSVGKLDVGAARYIRIYHIETEPRDSTKPRNQDILSLADLKVYSGGRDVAQGKAVVTAGADLTGDLGFYNLTIRSLSALTDGVQGDGAPVATVGPAVDAGNAPRGRMMYFDVDLGAGYVIDSIALWGNAGKTEESNNLRVYVSNTPFSQMTVPSSLSPSTSLPAKYFDFADLAAKGQMKQIDVAKVQTAGNTLSLDNLGSTGIAADLGKGTVIKTLPGTNVVLNTVGRYIRIYHIQDSATTKAAKSATVSLAELKVYSDGMEVAHEKTSGVDADIYRSGMFGDPLDRGENSDKALTDGRVGSGVPLASAKSDTSLVDILTQGREFDAERLYIDIDLKDQYSIDSISLWGNAGKPEESNNLRIYVSDKPFPSSSGEAYFGYFGSRSNPSVKSFDVATVTSSQSTATDTLTGIENLIGTELADSLTGTEKNDAITGDANANSLSGRGGNDAISGGAGNDMLWGDQGNDVLRGGDDNDKLYGGLDNDTLSAGAGDDFLYGDEGSDVLFAGAGNDWLEGGDAGGTDTADYSDIYLGGGIKASLVTGMVSKYETAGKPAKTDTLRGIENLVGTAAGDWLEGNELDNRLFGRAGNDTLSAGAGNDFLYGDEGADWLYAGAGNDWLEGGAAGGADTADYSTSGVAEGIDLRGHRAERAAIVGAGRHRAVGAHGKGAGPQAGRGNGDADIVDGGVVAGRAAGTEIAPGHGSCAHLQKQ